MSQENVEIIRQVYQGVTARREPPQELFDSAFECDATDVQVGVLYGFDGLQKGLGPYWETFEGFHIEVEEVIHANEEQVLTAVRDGGRMKGSDAEVWNRFFHVWTFGNGRIVRLSIHIDRDQALAAAGLQE